MCKGGTRDQGGTQGDLESAGDVLFLKLLVVCKQVFMLSLSYLLILWYVYFLILKNFQTTQNIPSQKVKVLSH